MSYFTEFSATWQQCPRLPSLPKLLLVLKGGKNNEILAAAHDKTEMSPRRQTLSFRRQLGDNLKGLLHQVYGSKLKGLFRYVCGDNLKELFHLVCGSKLKGLFRQVCGDNLKELFLKVSGANLKGLFNVCREKIKGTLRPCLR